ncbi:MAG: hypothetical protein FWG09_04785 [Synergistaceae bacterium]|nr:hypothetical protein [Synergistaceae bacterium]
MLNIAAGIGESYALEELEREIAAGSHSHALAVRSPESGHFELVIKIAKLALGNSGWIGDRHPDLLFAGENSMKSQKPPSIDECREFMAELSLLPVISNRRLGVVMYADQLLLPAANSLLKITEEPPSHVNLLYMMENDTLLPTLRSRVRYVSVWSAPHTESDVMPGNDAGWLEWAKNTKEVSDIVSSLERWGNYTLENGDAELAFKIESIRLLLDGGKLSKLMAQDLILLALKEEMAVEHSFGSFW